MQQDPITYDSRYLAGVMFFNDGDFFEAHEIWEDLWMQSAGAERKFFQGLIQAAVGLLHFGNGNLPGAVKLFHSSNGYLKDLPSPFHGLDLPRFGTLMTHCFKPLLRGDGIPAGVELYQEALPTIVLDPAPLSWPNPMDFVQEH
jgi:hypothetical protein